MKKVFILTLLLFTLSISAVSAQNSTQSGKLIRKEIINQKRDQFETRLKLLKDTRKQKIVENLDKSYANINARWTAHFKNVLDRLSKIADRINAPAKIKNQITATLTAIETQATKTYTIDLSDETKLGEAAQAIHQQLRSDLESLRDQIKDIRESLKTAVPAP